MQLSNGVLLLSSFAFFFTALITYPKEETTSFLPLFDLQTEELRKHNYLLYLLQLLRTLCTLNDAMSHTFMRLLCQKVMFFSVLFLSADVCKLCLYLPAVCGLFYCVFIVYLLWFYCFL